MIDVKTFLAEVAESRQRAQDAERAGFVLPPDLCLPAALEIALKHRWLISPVLARSFHSRHSAIVGIPSAERAQIEYWFTLYKENANWMLLTGEASGVAALEIELSRSTRSLARLMEDDCSWQDSLQFRERGRLFVLFGCEAGGLPSLGDRYPGLRLHAGDPILIPPSITVSGMELRYADSHAPLLPTPNELDQLEPSSPSLFDD